MSSSDRAIPPVSFYSPSGALAAKGVDDSTTASDLGVTLAPDASSDSSSASSTQTSVGFWKNGIWYSRPRTPAEERSHRGGGGPRRTQKKQDRAQAYFSGTWKPAWLQHYIDDRKSREDAAQASAETKVESQLPVEAEQPVAEPTSLTDVDPWSGQWQPSQQWWSGTWSSSSWWDSWGWSTSSTTSPPAHLHALPPPELPPNAGLFPDVNDIGHTAALHDLDGDHIWRMQLTNSERALLCEGGVPESAVSRLEEMLQRLEDYDSFELGPESRWGLARVTRRLDEGTESLGYILEVMLRRLRPRGRWPVVRTPRNEVDQLRMFNWVRRFSDIFVTTLQHHLDVPLQPREDLNELPGDRVTVEVAGDPPHAAAGVGEVLLGDTVEVENAEHGAEPEEEPPVDNANNVSDDPSSSSVRAERSRSRTPVPPPRIRTIQSVVAADGLRRALNGELMGVWAEEENTMPATSTSTTTTQWDSIFNATHLASSSWCSSLSSGTWSTSSSSMSSWSSSTSSTSLWCTTSWATAGVTMLPSQVQDLSPTFYGGSDMLAVAWELTIIGVTSTSSTSSTTSTTTDQLPAPEVRDVVAREMIMGGEADLVEVAHRLLARSRQLLRHQRGMLQALEEVLTWFPVPAAAVPFNAQTMDMQIWRSVTQAASSSSEEPSTQGEAVNSANLVGLDAAAPVVLLQPGFPSSSSQLGESLPGLPLRTIAGLRRRAWQVNAAHVSGTAPSSTQGQASESGDCDLYIIQTDTSSTVPLLPGCSELPRLSGRGPRHNRRRHRVPRPLPVVRDPEWLRRGRSSELARRPAPGSERGPESERSRVSRRARSRSHDA